MMDWHTGDAPPWSRFGLALEQQPQILRAILEALPKAADKDDAIDRVLGIYRWLELAGAQAHRMHCSGRREWAVSVLQEVGMAAGTHHLVQVLAASVDLADASVHCWPHLSAKQSRRCLQQARPRGVAKWMAALHQAERDAMGAHGHALAVKIYPCGKAFAPDEMWVLSLDEYLVEPVERRKQHEFTTFHLPDARLLAVMQARQMEQATSAASATPHARRI